MYTILLSFKGNVPAYYAYTKRIDFSVGFSENQRLLEFVYGSGDRVGSSISLKMGGKVVILENCVTRSLLLLSKKAVISEDRVARSPLLC